MLAGHGRRKETGAVSGDGSREDSGVRADAVADLVPRAAQGLGRQMRGAGEVPYHRQTDTGMLQRAGYTAPTAKSRAVGCLPSPAGTGCQVSRTKLNTRGWQPQSRTENLGQRTVQKQVL